MVRRYIDRNDCITVIYAVLYSTVRPSDMCQLSCVLPCPAVTVFPADVLAECSVNVNRWQSVSCLPHTLFFLFYDERSVLVLTKLKIKYSLEVVGNSRVVIGKPSDL
jgi:hypothetical protein